MNNTDTLAQLKLKRFLHYDPNTGHFTWLEKRGHMKPGDRAGCVDPEGYVAIVLHGIRYRASRLAYLYMTGSFPLVIVDHRNRVRHDNRWENLRPADYSENVFNRRKLKHNRSGITGVYWNKPRQKWMARIQVRGRRLFLGYFANKEDAATARQDAEHQYFSEFSPQLHMED